MTACVTADGRGGARPVSTRPKESVDCVSVASVSIVEGVCVVGGIGDAAGLAGDPDAERPRDR